MKEFLIIYVCIGCLFSVFIKNAIDSVGIDYLIEQIDEKPDIDLDNPMVQILFILVSVLLWPIYVFGMFKDNGE